MTTMDNRALLYGDLSEEPSYSHAVGSTRMYRCTLEVPRQSGTRDKIPLLIPEHLLSAMRDRIGVLGQLRGYSRQVNGKRHLFLCVLVRELVYEPAQNNNLVSLKAKLTRRPTYRTTPMGREIADLLLRVEREHGGVDCIPAIVWGGCARFARNLEKDQLLRLEGRVQSRAYMKRTPEGLIEEMVAFELSVNKLSLL